MDSAAEKGGLPVALVPFVVSTGLLGLAGVVTSTCTENVCGAKTLNSNSVGSV